MLTKSRMEVLSFIGAGAAAVAAGIWTLLLYFQPEQVAADLKFTVCVGSQMCQVGEQYPCGTDINKVLADKCASFKEALRTAEQTSIKGGGACGIATYELTCKVSPK